MTSSVRDYAILWVGARTGASGGGSAALGGNALLTVPQHALDGPEHTNGGDGTRLDATVDRHGLLPVLSGLVGDAFRGDGTFGPIVGAVPTFIAAGETFTVPAYRQALYAMTIDNEGILDLEGFLVAVP